MLCYARTRVSYRLSPKEYSESTFTNARSFIQRGANLPLDSQHLNYAKPMPDAIAMQEIDFHALRGRHRGENVASRCLRMW